MRIGRRHELAPGVREEYYIYAPCPKAAQGGVNASGPHAGERGLRINFLTEREAHWTASAINEKIEREKDGEGT
jgi:hypothetical protein